MVEKSNSYEKEQANQNIDVFPWIQEEKNTLKDNIEIPKDYGKTFLDYLTEYPITKGKIESYLQEPETIETRSLKIENIWWEFSFWALDANLQETMKKNPTLLQNMKTGLSLYFTDRLNNLSQSQLKDVSQVGNGMNGLLSKASDLMGIFKNLNSFKEQMSAITHITEGMDIYSKNLSSDENNNIASLEAFQSPEWFVRLLKKHTLNPGIQRPTSFGSFEDYFNINQQASINSADIMTKLADSYNDNAHTLMIKVSKLWPKVLESRNTIKTTFGQLYDQVSQIFSLFNDGKPLSELIKGSWLEKPLNFVSSILGFGSLVRYEARNNIKNNTQQLPDSQKKGLLAAIDFVNHNDSTKVSESFTKIFDKTPQDIYKKYALTKENIAWELPDEYVLKKGIERTLLTDDSFFIDPRVLKKLGLENTDQYYTTDPSGKTILNPVTLSSYQTLIKDNLDKIIQDVWLGKEGLLEPEKIMKMIQEWKTKSHISSYLLSWLSFPDYPADIIDSWQKIKDKKQEDIVVKEKKEYWEEKFLNKWTHIKRQDAIIEFGKTAAVRNFNPWNISDTLFWWQKIDWERFTRFDSPQEWFQALIDKIKNIQSWWSKVYQANMSLKDYMYKYAPPHENDTNKYIADISQELNITWSTQIKDIDAVQLAITHAKKEDWKSYKMLQKLWIIS